VRQLAHRLALLPPTDPFRIKLETLLLEKLHSMGLLSQKSKMSEVEKKLTVASICRRRLPVVMTRLRMAESVKAATKLIEQGHVRVGPEVVTDPAYVVTRRLEDFVTWTDGSKIRKNIMVYKGEVDDYDLLA
jgi:U3 small nucleolar ribonucleoprotein protein IMP3